MNVQPPFPLWRLSVEKAFIGWPLCKMAKRIPHTHTLARISFCTKLNWISIELITSANIKISVNRKIVDFSDAYHINRTHEDTATMLKDTPWNNPFYSWYHFKDNQNIWNTYTMDTLNFMAKTCNSQKLTFQIKTSHLKYSINGASV